MIIKYSFYLPISLKLFLIKNTTTWLMIQFSNFIFTTRLSTTVTFNPLTRIMSTYRPTSTLALIVNSIKNTSLIHTTTLRFKGKGYKLVKHPALINLKFNFAHPQYFIARKTITLKTGKNKLTLLNANIVSLKKITETLLTVRKINVYTKNGLRMKKQIIHRRKGKTLNT